MDTKALTYLAEVFIHFSLGVIVGWFARGFKERFTGKMDVEKLIALFILMVYVLSVVADMLNPAYETPLALHGIMGVVVGFYFKKRGIK